MEKKEREQLKGRLLKMVVNEPRPESMEELLTNETLSSSSIMILKVKKPDLLGDSMWELRYGTKPMEVKITDESIEYLGRDFI